jgi:hypothetical protein
MGKGKQKAETLRRSPLPMKSGVRGENQSTAIFFMVGTRPT